MLTVTDLGKRFGSVEAVKRISFSVDKGEVFGLLGANGAGKTTTLRMLATMLTPSEGTASVDGFDLVKSPDEIRARIGLMFGGETGLYDRLTARENILYFADLGGVPRDVAEERIARLTDAFNFKEYANTWGGKLSKGTRQKVSFARAIIHDPAVMLFDEPLLGLDVTSRKEAEDFIRLCAQDKKTIILSDHSLDVVSRLCSRVGILHKGELREMGTIEELCARHGKSSLEDVFFGLTGNRGEEEA